MTTMNKKWADVEEDDFPTFEKNRFESEIDEFGIKTITEYVERDGTQLKVTRKVKTNVTEKKINKAAESRKNLKKFGKDASADHEEHGDCRAIEEDIMIEATKRNLGVAMDEFDKFLEAEAEAQLGKKEKAGAWAARRKDDDDTSRPTAFAARADAAEAKVAADANNRDASGKYVPPSVRQARAGQESRFADQRQREEFTLRVTNLSEDVREGDLNDLFGQFGKLWRVFLAKHPDSKESKGFAFVTYCNKHDADRAIAKLNGHGYDNLILNVAYAKPRAP